MIGVTFSVLASIPRLLMMKPSIFLDGTPKTHFVGFCFHQNFCRLSKVSCRSLFVRILGLDDHIIHVGFDIAVQLLSEVELDCPLIGSHHILQPKGHSFVIDICTVWGDEYNFDLILFLEDDLLIV